MLSNNNSVGKAALLASTLLKFKSSSTVAMKLDYNYVQDFVSRKVRNELLCTYYDVN